METKILSSIPLRDTKAEELREAIKTFDRKPSLAILQMGMRPESDAYITQKIRFGERIGCEVRHIRLDEGSSESALKGEIEKLNSDLGIDGIIVQLPLPSHVDVYAAIEVIDPAKDVDGLTSMSAKRLLSGDMTGFVPATTKGILSLLKHYGIQIAGKNAVVVGRSNLVGKPTALALLNLDATVTVAHSKTSDLAKETKMADIVVVAAGVPGLIGAKHVSPGQTIIDVGITAVIDELGKRTLRGDVDREAVMGIVAALSPVPGGAGPLTVASLFENVIQAYGMKHEASSIG